MATAFRCGRAVESSNRWGPRERRFATMDLGPTELLIVLALALLLFGGAKLPKLARSMGEASREFRKGVEGHHHDEEPSEPTA
jgi:sec-independent protein translocase protein TatA